MPGRNTRGKLRRLTSLLVITIFGILGLGLGVVHADPIWSGYAGNAQHTADSSVASMPLNAIRWSTPVDDVLACCESLIWFMCPSGHFWIFSGAWTMGMRAIVHASYYLTQCSESRSKLGRK